MPSPVGFAAKFAPDPDRPGRVVVVGSYAHDFLTWAKLFGKPSWSRSGKQIIVGRKIWLREPIFETKNLTGGAGGNESVLTQKASTVQMEWPLTVLEPIFEKMQKWNPVGLINPHDGEVGTRGCI
jgi:hypothetical protein